MPVVATLSSDNTTKTICSIDGRLAARETNGTLMWAAYKGPSFETLHVSSLANIATTAGSISGLQAAVDENTQQAIGAVLDKDEKSTPLADTGAKLAGRVKAGVEASLTVCKDQLTSAFATWKSAGSPFTRVWSSPNGERHQIGLTNFAADFPKKLKERHQFVPQSYEDVNYKQRTVGSRLRTLTPL